MTRKKAVRRILCVILSLSLVIGSALAAEKHRIPYSYTKGILSDFAVQYGWSTGNMVQKEWTGLDEKKYSRPYDREMSKYESLLEFNKQFAVDLGMDDIILDLKASGGNDIVEIAMAEVGSHPGGLPYKQYFRDTPGIVNGTGGINAGTAWCAIFVTWCAAQLDLVHYDRSTKTEYGIFPGYGYANPIWIKGHLTNVMGFDSYPPLSARPFGGPNEVFPGDIAIWCNGDIGNGQTYSHIGIVSEVGEDYIYIVSGNVSYKGNNGVNNSKYTKRGVQNDWRLMNGWIIHVIYPDSGEMDTAGGDSE